MKSKVNYMYTNIHNSFHIHKYSSWFFPNALLIVLKRRGLILDVITRRDNSKPGCLFFFISSRETISVNDWTRKWGKHLLESRGCLQAISNFWYFWNVTSSGQHPDSASLIDAASIFWLIVSWYFWCSYRDFRYDLERRSISNSTHNYS